MCSTDISLKPIYISDIPIAHGDVYLSGTAVHLARCKTGYGYRHYFVCPKCGQRRTMLCEFQGQLLCRSCLPFDIYQWRRNLYDEGGMKLITWHMQKLAKSVGIEKLRHPFHYLDYTFDRPRYMRRSKYEKIIKQLQVLDKMRLSAHAGYKRFTAADIKFYTSEYFLDLYDICDIEEKLMFCDR